MTYNPHNAAVVFDGGDAPAVLTRKLAASRRTRMGSEGQVVLGVFDRAGSSATLRRDDEHITAEVERRGWEVLVTHRAELSIPWAPSESLRLLEGEGGSERWMILFYHPSAYTTNISPLREAVIGTAIDAAVVEVAFRGTKVSSKRELRWMLAPLADAVTAGDTYRSHLEAHKLFWSVAKDTYASANHQFWSLCPNTSIEEACTHVEHVLGNRDTVGLADRKLDRAVSWLDIIGAYEDAEDAAEARMAARLLDADPALAGGGLQDAVQAVLV